jgi:hypothetical protein
MVNEGRIEKTVPGIFPLMKQPMWSNGIPF